MASTAGNKTNIVEHMKNRQLDKERHQRLAEAMDEAVKILEEAAEAVKQGQWDERLGAVLTALESKEKPSIPFALGSLGLESVPEALRNEEHKEGVQLFQSFLEKKTEEENFQNEAKEQVSPRRQRTRSTNEVPTIDSRYNLDLEKTLYPRLRQTLSTLTKDKISIPFRKPVTLAEAPNYYDVITNPMDLSTMRKKLDKGVYKHPKQFLQDLNLICENAFHYNEKKSEVYELAEELKKRIENLMKPVLEEWSAIEQAMTEDSEKVNYEAALSETRESEVIPAPSRKTRKKTNTSNRESKSSDNVNSVNVEVQESKSPNAEDAKVVNMSTTENDSSAITSKDRETEQPVEKQVEQKSENEDTNLKVANDELVSEANNNNAVEDGESVAENAAEDIATDRQSNKRKNTGKRNTNENRSKGSSSRSKRRSRSRR